MISAFGCCIQRSELGLLAELGPESCSYCSSYLDRRSRFPVLINSSYRTATELILTGTDSQSERGLLRDLESRNYSYCSSHLRRCCRSSVLNSGCGEATGLVIRETDSETSGASACRIQSSELGLLPELGPRNYSYCSSNL
eukprot:6808794-Pyramimonas_sp.AAC.1